MANGRENGVLGRGHSESEGGIGNVEVGKKDEAKRWQNWIRDLIGKGHRAKDFGL